VEKFIPFFVGVIMVNTGNWNSDFCVVLVLLMLLPLFVHFLAEIIRSFYNISTTENNTAQLDFESIADVAMKQAMQGNSSARAWVTKHVFEPNRKKAKKKKQSAQFLTNKTVMQDCLDGLVKLKYKKEDAKKAVIKVAKRKEYKDPGVMFVDCLKEI